MRSRTELLMSSSTSAVLSPTIKVAVAQIASTFNVQSTLNKVASCIEEAAKSSTKLIVFPEATIGGYPKYQTFGTSIGERTQRGRTNFEEYANGAITVPGPEITKIAEMACKARIFIVIGVI